MKSNPVIKCFDILCLEQYITDKQSNKSEEKSDTDSVNSELNNWICYSNKLRPEVLQVQKHGPKHGSKDKKFHGHVI